MHYIWFIEIPFLIQLISHDSIDVLKFSWVGKNLALTSESVTVSKVLTKSSAVQPATVQDSKYWIRGAESLRIRVPIVWIIWSILNGILRAN